MDQESFRKLLHTPKASSSSGSTPAHVRGSLLTAATSGQGGKKARAGDASQPASFKPRQLKKGAKAEAYRDRATERRLGTANDYAQVEALADEFEKRNADNADREAVEAQRKYLGGDSAHTVLVKGLDFALLEQARARVAAESAATDDVSLEAAYLESAAQGPPRKRTREEILRDLKRTRGGSAARASAGPRGAGAAGGDGDGFAAAVEEEDRALEEAKKAGKFRPIGFKPIGGGADGGEKAKRKKKARAGEREEEGERRKKKRKVAPPTAEIVQERPAREDVGAGPSTSVAAAPVVPDKPEPEPEGEDVDIFADAGEYTGVDLGGDSDSDGEVGHAGASPAPREEGDGALPAPRKWLTTSDDERETSRAAPRLSPRARSDRSRSRSASPQRRASGRNTSPAVEDGEMEAEEGERPMRLQPLSSSALPSIKDLLAMNEESEKAEKRRARKEKKKAGGGGAGKEGGGGEKDTKAKVERDYQRLKAYTDKKAKS
ncbi:RED-like protein N-terminal region-domain-containing protein [Trametes gibbosa]|nr:RED-like protein N-terminal region-domain-containing protein [Trametes gibbosa]